MAMNNMQDYIIQVAKKLDSGDLPSFPDPPPPSDLGTPFTQEQIDFLKSIIKEMERFTPIDDGT